MNVCVGVCVTHFFPRAIILKRHSSRIPMSCYSIYGQYDFPILVFRGFFIFSNVSLSIKKGSPFSVTKNIVDYYYDVLYQSAN